MQFLNNLNVLVLGLGTSGLAMARWCVRFGAQVSVWDSREQAPQDAALAQDLPQVQRLHSLPGAASLGQAGGYQLMLKSPGLAPTDTHIAALLQHAQQVGLLVLGELDLFARALADLKAQRGYAPKVLAITGTNGKTTVTAMTALLVQRAGRSVVVAGNIGPTLLDSLAQQLDLVPVVEPVIEPDVEPDVAPAAAPAAVSVEPLAASLSEASIESPQAFATVSVVAFAVDLKPDANAEQVVDAVADEDDDWDDQPQAQRVLDSDVDDDVDSIDAGEDGPIPAGPANAAAQTTEAPLDDDSPRLPEVWVLELSSFQLMGGGLGVQGFNPSAATVLNLSQDHLDWHGNETAYAAAKTRIFGQTGALILNRDDQAVAAMVPAAPVKAKAKFGVKAAPVAAPRVVLHFSLGRPQAPGDFGLVEEAGMAWLVRAMPIDQTIKRKKGDPEEELFLQRLMPADALRVRGRHNAANALAALALATAIGCPLAPMLHGLREYRGEPHRVQFVALVDGVESFDDSKGTNVGATVAALKGLGADKAPNRLVVILGGDGKGQDFQPLLAPLQQHARAVATLGRDAQQIEAVLAGASNLLVQRCADMAEAVNWGFARAHAGDALLLSPACASLDMFNNYEHRAQVFVQAVQSYAADRGQA